MSSNFNTAPVLAFLPCRKGSERVKRKNVKPFGGVDFGLLEIKIGQIIHARNIDYLILSTDDPEVISFAKTVDSPKLIIHKRDESLAQSKTSTDDLVPHVVDLAQKVSCDINILWTHVTSPFLTSKIYDSIISQYKNLGEGYDSLMTVTPFRGFLWDEFGPINYDPNQEKWPRTQTLDPVYEINSGAFLSHLDVYKEYGNRIGLTPKLFPLNKLIAFDIDWEEDFLLAQRLLEEGLVSI